MAQTDQHGKIFRQIQYAIMTVEENSVDGLIIFELADEDILESELGIGVKLHRRKIVNGRSQADGSNTSA